MASKDKKFVKTKSDITGNKVPKNIEDPDSYLKKTPVWVFKRCDREHEKWSLNKCDNFYEDILDKLISFESMTWSEIMSAAGGRTSGTNSHFELISEMVKEAQRRAMELKLDVDQLFSLRLEGKKRLYGIIDNGKFYIVWYTSDHDIYLSNKKHT